MKVFLLHLLIFIYFSISYYFENLASSSSSSSSRHSNFINHSDSSSGQIIEIKTTPRTNAKEAVLRSEQKSPRKTKKPIKSKSLESKTASFSLFADSFIQAENFLYRPNKFCKSDRIFGVGRKL
jgi:hypothetical protein